FHQPSATTDPCRISMKLFMVSIWRSAVSTKSRMAADEIPWRSGVLRGKERELSTTTSCRLAGRRGDCCAGEFERGEKKAIRTRHRRNRRMGDNIPASIPRERDLPQKCNYVVFSV